MFLASGLLASRSLIRPSVPKRSVSFIPFPIRNSLDTTLTQHFAICGTMHLFALYMTSIYGKDSFYHWFAITTGAAIFPVYLVGGLIYLVASDLLTSKPQPRIPEKKAQTSFFEDFVTLLTIPFEKNRKQT